MPVRPGLSAHTLDSGQSPGGGAARLQRVKPRLPSPLLLLLLLACAIPALAVEPAPPTAELVLSRLAPRHPRLLATAEDFSRLEKLTASGFAAKWLAEVRRQADEIVKAKPSKYEIPDGKRLLATSRRVVERTVTLALIFRLQGDPRHAERLWQELDAAARFKDWNPSHFLDTAEMTAAFAIGYDWLFDTWTAEQRAVLRKAIIEMGLKQSLPLYRQQKWWVVADHNWNQVCNGGMTLGALALADEERELAAEILPAAIASVRRPMREFAPDGAWGEGPGYWDYAVAYNVAMIATLDSALGTDFGLSKIEGFSKAGDFPIHTTGPTGRAFNYADAGSGGCGGPHMLWLATRFERPDFAAFRIARAGGKPSAVDLLFGARWLEHPPASQAAPLAKHFRGSEVVTLRSAWNDPQATFVAFKGGSNAVNHSHLDLGSFVLDAAGERWAFDLGADNYNLPGYFGKQRWDYYRLRAEGQNTLVIAPDAKPDQAPKARAPVTAFGAKPEASFGVVDLSEAYAGRASAVRRGFRLAGRDVLVQDEIETAQPTEVWWFMHTGAAVTCDGATATLVQNGRRLTARLLAPAGASFEVLPAEPLPTSPHPARQQEKRGPVKKPVKLAVHLPAASSPRIAVLFSPEAEPAAPAKLVPLADWK